MKRLSILLISIILVLVGAASANADPVIVAGTIYEADHVTEVSDADVHIECNGVEKDTTSDPDGDYSEDFTGTNCSVGDTVTVTATKDGASGSETDTVEDYTYVDIAIINVSIPEFGTITAGLALAGSSLGYMYFRRKIYSRKRK